MKTLILDTSCGVRVMLRTESKEYVFCDEKLKAASAVLLPKIDEFLTAEGLAVKDLDAIAVVVGPGSFTGIRIAVNTARAFSYVTGAPLYGINALSLGALSLREPCLSVLFGWASTCYAQEYDGEGNAVSEPFAIELSDFDGTQRLVCDQAAAQRLGFGETYDVIAALRKAADKAIEEGNGAWNEVEPLYVMPSQAERDLQRKQGN